MIGKYVPSWELGEYMYSQSLYVEQSRKKTQHIYVPKDWEQVVVQAWQKNPFQVCRMNREDFVSLKPLKAAIVNPLYPNDDYSRHE